MTYQQAQKQAEMIRAKCKDYLDIPNHAQARRVQQDIEGLVNDTKQKKSRESIDSRLKTLISSLEQVEEEVMDFNHSNQLKSWCEDMRRDTRGL